LPFYQFIGLLVHDLSFCPGYKLVAFLRAAVPYQLLVKLNNCINGLTNKYLFGLLEFLGASQATRLTFF
jgi:hypothetical protein